MSPGLETCAEEKERKISLCVHLCLPSNHEYNRSASSCSCLHGFPAVMDSVHLWTQINPSFFTHFTWHFVTATKKIAQGNGCRYALQWFSGLGTLPVAFVMVFNGFERRQAFVSPTLSCALTDLVIWSAEMKLFFGECSCWVSQWLGSLFLSGFQGSLLYSLCV